MALTDAFKSLIDVQLGVTELVTPVLVKTQILIKVLSAPHGETKAENIYHSPKVSESCGQFIRMTTSNLLSIAIISKIIFSDQN